MSSRLIVHNLPRNLNQEGFIKIFSDLRGFLGGSLLINSQDEIYGIVEFASIDLADYARKVKSGFKFHGSHFPITIDFFYQQGQQDYYPGSNPLNTGSSPSPNLQNQPNLMNMSNIPSQMGSSPSINTQGNFQNYGKIDHQGPSNQDYMQPHFQHPQQNPRFPMEGPQNPEIFPMPQNQPTQAPLNQNYNYQNPSNQYIPMNQGINKNPNSQQFNPSFGMNPNLGGQQNFANPQMATNPNISKGPQFNMSQPTQMGSQQQPQQPFFNAPQGGNQSLFAGKMMNMRNTGGTNIQGGRSQSNDEDFELFKVPPKATSSIYVDGIPIDANEREVSHVFRPFPGFKEVRLIKKESKSGRKFYFCFVDFENSLQSTIALHTLQGYRFDKSDKKGLKISFAYHAQDSPRSIPHNKGHPHSYR